MKFFAPMALIPLALTLITGCTDTDDPKPDARVADGPKSEGGTGKDGNGDPDATTGQCLPKMGNAGAVTISTTKAAAVIDQASGDAMNTLDHLRFTQLATGSMHTLALGACGKGGLLIRTASGSKKKLQYFDPTAATPAYELVEDGVSSQRDGALFFDNSCEPIVLRALKDGYQRYTRQTNGTWQKGAVAATVESALGGPASSLKAISASRGGDGKLYLFAKATSDSNAKLLVAARSEQAGSSWSLSALPYPAASEIHDLKVAKDGTMHVLFRNTSYPCDPCNVDYYYGVLNGNSWQTEVVQKGQWGAPDDAFIEWGSLALDPTGKPYVAAHFVRRAVTGSYKSAELRLYSKTSAGWCHDVVADKVDGFAGQDGMQFTGANPQLLMDTAGRLHVLFQDQSLWHDSTGQNEQRGQLRYAVRIGSAWHRETLYAQQGQKQSKQPIISLVSPLFALSADGSSLVAAGVVVSWETNSIYNQMEKAASYQAQTLGATVALP